MIITFMAYQSAAERTKQPEPSRERALANYALGLVGEAGGVAEELRTHLFQCRSLDTEKLKDKLGDVLWYIAALATELHLKLEDIAGENVVKLYGYPNGAGAEDGGSRRN